MTKLPEVGKRYRCKCVDEIDIVISTENSYIKMESGNWYNLSHFWMLFEELPEEKEGKCFHVCALGKCVLCGEFVGIEVKKEEKDKVQVALEEIKTMLSDFHFNDFIEEGETIMNNSSLKHIDKKVRNLINALEDKQEVKAEYPPEFIDALEKNLKKEIADGKTDAINKFLTMVGINGERFKAKQEEMNSLEDGLVDKQWKEAGRNDYFSSSIYAKKQQERMESLSTNSGVFNDLYNKIKKQDIWKPVSELRHLGMYINPALVHFKKADEIMLGEVEGLKFHAMNITHQEKETHTLKDGDMFCYFQDFILEHNDMKERIERLEKLAHFADMNKA